MVSDDGQGMSTCAVPWGCVTHTAERVAIVGTGPSMAGASLRFPPSVSVIAVNAAVELLEEPPTFWFTLDTSPSNRLFMRNQLPGTIYYAAVYDNFGTPEILPKYNQDPPEPNVTYLRRIVGKGKNFSTPGLSEDPTGIHVGNSGYGALGLAYLMGATRIALFGIDGHGKYAKRPGRPRRVDHLAWLFATAVQQIRERGVEMVVASTISKVRSWPQMGHEEAIRWLAA